MAMVGVGGSIGTGLLLGSAAAIQIAGPAVILSFVLAALIAYAVSMAMGELASVHPSAGSFGTYAEIYLNPWAGFVSRYGFWIAIAMAIGGEMVASATYMRQWLPGVPAIAWICVFAVALLAVNLMSVGHYGWFEYGFAMVKLVTMAAFVVLGGALLLTGHFPVQYTANGGFFAKGQAAPMYAMGWRWWPSRPGNRAAGARWGGRWPWRSRCWRSSIWERSSCWWASCRGTARA